MQGVTLWVWNFLMWIPTCAASGVPLLFIALVDLGFVVLLGFVAWYQAQFVPHSKVECGYVANTSYQVPAGSLSFFQAAAALNVTDDPSPVGACEVFVDQWALGIAILVFLCLSALANLVGGCATATDPAREGRRLKHVGREAAKVVGYALAAVPLLLFLACKLILRVLWAVGRRVTPLPAQQRLVYAYLYGIKLLRRVPLPRPRVPARLRRVRWRFWQRTPPSSSPSPTTSTTAITEKSPAPLPSAAATARATRLASLLPFDILALLATHVHYTDLINLSLTTRAFRATIFPADEPARRERLRVYACAAGAKAPCWGCGAPTCGDCGSARAFPDTRTAAHLARCGPRCAGCFFKEVVKGRPLGVACPGCRVGGGAGVGKRVCRDCKGLSNGELLGRRERRDREEALFLMQMGVSCGSCGVGLPERGPRWWVCGTCGRECRDRVHPAWAGKGG